MRRFVSPLLVLVFAVVTGLRAVPASAATTVTQDSLVPVESAAGVPVAATLHVHSSACLQVRALTVAVRDLNGGQWDFRGARDDVTICPEGFTLTTGARTFPAGTYTAFGAYLLDGVWTKLGAQPFTVGAVGAPAPAAGARSAAAAVAPSWNPSGTYTFVGGDEFDGGALDTTLWERGWFPTEPDQVTVPVSQALDTACYDPTYVTQPGDGFLHLKLNNVASTCGGVTRPNTGSLVSSRNNLSRFGGSFEARVFLPASPSGGVAGWPAWWLNGPDWMAWPAHGEIDIVEAQHGSTSGHVHYDTGSGQDANQGWTSAAPYVGWHDFGVAWTTTGPASTVSYFWDGQLMSTVEMPATVAEYLVFVYSTSDLSAPPGAWPAEMLVDWVRIWQ